MKALRRLTAAVLALGLHFSLCTGGLLSIASALTVDVSQTYLVSDTLMTPALQEVSLCASMTPAPTETADKADVTQSAGCDQGKTCLLSATVGGKERSVVSSPFIFVIIKAPEPANEVFVAEQPPGFARAGPRHEDARLLASVLLKRE